MMTCPKGTVSSDLRPSYVNRSNSHPETWHMLYKSNYYLNYSYNIYVYTYIKYIP